MTNNMKRTKIKTIKCRTCLQSADINYSTNITKELMLGKSIKDVLLLFVPQMIISPLVDDFICSKCTDMMFNFATFVQNIIKVEKYLLEQNVKSPRTNKNMQANANEVSGIANNYLVVNTEPIVQPVQFLQLPLNMCQLIFVPNSNTNKPLQTLTFENSTETVKNPTVVNTDIQQTFNFPILISQMNSGSDSSVATKGNCVRKENRETNEQVTNNKGTNYNPTKVNTSAPTIQNMSLLNFEWKVCKTCGNYFGSPNGNQVDCLKCTALKEIQCDLEALKYCNNDGTLKTTIKNKSAPVKSQFTKAIISTSNPEVINENSNENTQDKWVLSLGSSHESDAEIPTLEIKTETAEYDDTLGDASDFLLQENVSKTNKSKQGKKLANTIISTQLLSENVKELLQEYSKGIKVIDQSSIDNAPKKRVLFLGDAMRSTVQCKECKIYLQNPKALTDHFEEGFCDYSIADMSDLDDIDEENIKCECSICNIKLSTSLLLTKHLKQEHGLETNFKCDKCGKTFDKKCAYTKHMKIFENSPDCSRRKCCICKELIAIVGFRKHSESHKEVTCDQCGKQFTSPGYLKLHYSKHDENRKKIKKEKSVLCNVCGKLLCSAQALTQHLKTHANRTRDYMCDMCPKAFMSHTNLKCHIKTTHRDIKYECNICHCKVKSTTALYSHNKLKHSEKKSHVCSICGQGFSRSDYYQRHMAKHNDVCNSGRTLTAWQRKGKVKYKYSVKYESKPVQCKYCQKYFKNVYLLRTHLLSHVKSLRYSCKFCSMTFTNITNRWRHQKRHADPNFQLSCSVCWRRMNNKEELEAHFVKHQKTKKNQCKTCGEMFMSRYWLMHHMTKHTSKDKIEKEKQTVLEALDDFMVKKTNL